MLVSLECQVTLLLVASDGDTIAVREVVEPTSTDALVGLTVTPAAVTLSVLPPLPFTSFFLRGRGLSPPTRGKL